MIARVYIGLGANIDDPRRQLEDALQALQQHPCIQVNICSSFYGSKPVGPQDQPDFVNAVACIATSLTPEQLLDALQAQERQQGRIKLRHWGERCIDLDILLYGDQVVESERLRIPHPQMLLRSFVLLPLHEIAPDLVFPDGHPLQQDIDRMPAESSAGNQEPLIRLSAAVNNTGN